MSTAEDVVPRLQSFTYPSTSFADGQPMDGIYINKRRVDVCIMSVHLAFLLVAQVPDMRLVSSIYDNLYIIHL